MAAELWLIKIQAICVEKVTLACLASFSGFWQYKCPCNFPLDESIAFKLHTQIYFDFIFKLE